MSRRQAKRARFYAQNRRRRAYWSEFREIDWGRCKLLLTFHTAESFADLYLQRPYCEDVDGSAYSRRPLP